MKKYIEKRTLIAMCAVLFGMQPTVKAYLFGMQPTVKAQDNYNYNYALLFVAAVFLWNFPSIYSFVKKNILPKKVVDWFNTQPPSVPDSVGLRDVKKNFDTIFEKWRVDNSFLWVEECYTKVAKEKEFNGVKKFIEKQEESANISTRVWSSWTVSDLVQESMLIKIKNMAISSNELLCYTRALGQVPDKTTLSLACFTDYALASIADERLKQRNKFLAVCCAMYPCESGIKSAIKKEYPNIKASRILKVFEEAHKIHNGKNSINQENSLILKTTILPLCSST